MTNVEEPNYFADAQLKQDMTFDSLAIGPCNESAVKSCKLLVKQYPSSLLSPLLIIASKGLGKTHLASAIGNALIRSNPQLKVLFTTAADFCYEYVQFAQSEQPAESFIRFFRENVDVLIVDDVEYFWNKPASTRMFNYIVDEFIRAGKTVIATGNPDVWETSEMTLALSTDQWKFFPIHLEKPDRDTAKRFIRISKASGRGAQVKIDDDVIDYLIANYSTDFLLLSGALNRLLFFTVFVRETDQADMGLASKALEGLNLNS